MRTKFKGLWTLLLALVVQISFAQEKKVSGTVTDASTGEPLPSVNVVVQGTQKGTVTDFDGKYSIMASPDDVLVFSFTGYNEKKVKVGNQSVINVKLVPGEVLKTAYVDISGKKQEAKQLSYAVQSVSAEKLQLSDISNVESAISGKIAGAQVWEQAGSKLGSAPKVRIRGRISLNTDTDPLYVVDGTPGVDPTMINPDDIESVEVLKGANATAIYGQRGDKGVVVITTKKAKNGTFGVDINSKVTFEKIAYLPKYQNDYGQGAAGDGDWGVFQLNPAPYQTYPEWSVFDGKRYNLRTYYDESWGPKFDGEEYVPWYAWWPDSPYFGQTAKWEAQPNNVKNFYDSGVYLKNDVAIFTAHKGYSVRLSFSNLNQKGVIPFSKYGRNYITSNLQYGISDKLKVGTTIIYSQYKRHGDFDDQYGNQTSGSFNAWFARDLDMAKQKELIDLKTPEGYYASWNYWRAQWISDYASFAGYEYLKKPVFWFNHYTWLRDYDRNGFGNQLVGSIWADYKITKSLSAKVLIGRYQNNRNSNYFLPYQIEYSSAHEAYTSWINSFGIANSNYTEDNYNLFLHYDSKINDDVSFNAMLGTTWLKQDGFGTSTWMNPEDTENGLIVPDDYLFANMKQRVPTSRSAFHKRVYSIFGKATFGYKDMLFLTATGRQDWSSALPKDNNGYFYPSVGLTFNFGDLDFFKDNENLSKVLSSGKFRIDWAQVGSDLDPHLIYPTYHLFGAGGYFGNATMVSPSYVVDPNLKPAINSSFETGFDLGLLNDRIGFGFTYYYEKRKDEIIFQHISASTGYGSYLTNGGTSHRSGVEITLSGSPIKKKDFAWNMDLNIAYNKSVVDEIPGVSTEMPAPGGRSWSNGDTWGRVTLVQVEGKEWGQLRGYDIKRDKNGNPVLSPNGFYMPTDKLVYFGSVLPHITGGFTNVISYKDFTLAAHLTFQKGGKFFSGSEVWGYYSGLYEETGMGGHREDGVEVKGVDNSGAEVRHIVPARSYYKQFHANNLAGPFVHDASFLKLREVSLTYNLPKKFVGKYLKGASISIIGTNLSMLAVAKDNYHRWDPSEMSQAYGEDAQLPGTRRFGMNIKLSF